MKDKIKIACDPSVVRRALIYAGIVGTLLIGINHGDAILSGELNTTRLLKMGLTVIVPYLVSTFSSVGTIHQVKKVDSQKP